MEGIKKRFEEETGKKWWTNPVCHGELGFASWDYQIWLENKVADIQSEIEKAKIDGKIEENERWLRAMGQLNTMTVTAPTMHKRNEELKSQLKGE